LNDPWHRVFHVKQDATDAIAARFDVSRETLERLTLFGDLLLRWNRTINLISRADEANLWPRHIADSLQLNAHVPPGTSVAIDFGSGAGFPGLVLAIGTGTKFHLVEADTRKAAFLREAARETAAPVTVHACRIEAAALAAAPLVTARALAPLSNLLALASPFLAEGGICLFPKGRDAELELTDAARTWNMRVEKIPSQVDRSGVILRISEVARV
jgi:16S rRNA (guanine527-N7)-methyltransferase